MNSSVYIFGSFGNGYEQYPDDYAKEIFKNVYAKANNPSQVIVHRENSLMYYYYIRKLDYNNQYIGLCILLNGVMFTKIKKVFSLFENAVTQFVETGKILKFDDNGNIVASGSTLIKEEVEVERISIHLQDELDGNLFLTREIPPNSYSISNSEVRYFSVDDKDVDIITSSHQNGYTIIAKQKGGDTDAINGYRGVIRRLNKDKLETQTKYEKLKDDYDTLKKQKEQYRIVLLLIFLVVIVFIIFMSINNRLSYDLETTSSQLTDAESTIEMQYDSLYFKNKQINNLNESVCNLNTKLSESRIAKKQFEEELKGLKSIQPLFIKNSSFDFNSKTLSFEYLGTKDTTINMNLRVYNNSTEYSLTYSIDIMEGNNNQTFHVNKYFSSDEWYSFELLIGNKIIGGGRH